MKKMTEVRLYWHIVYFRHAFVQRLVAHAAVADHDAYLGIVERVEQLFTGEKICERW